MIEHMFVRLGFVLVAAVLLWAVLARNSGAGSTPQHHTVRAGETLWSIAAARYGGDPREGVWKVREANDLATSTIVPGERLLLP